MIFIRTTYDIRTQGVWKKITTKKMLIYSCYYISQVSFIETELMGYIEREIDIKDLL